MSDAGDPREFDLFDRALAVPEHERAAFLAGQCGGDEPLRARVERLLVAHADAEAAETAERVGLAPPAPLRGTTVGGYELLGRIGAGGMGTVYEAEQSNPRRRVALKLLHPGLASPAALRRFEYEAEALGRLGHEGIARVHEAGIADLGFGPQPWIAMEKIDGSPLTVHSRRHGLGDTERLELLVAICEAVHHAHLRGVIHRDLKPDNILVGEDGAPRLVDFGIARATGAADEQASPGTATGELLGTLPYMSPEQVAGRPDEIDVQSDVHALGVVGYELLSGELPRDVAGRTTGEALRLLQEQDATPLPRVAPRFAGDVATILGKALERDKRRRYASAAELADDLRRHLEHLPIRARPASTVYQLRKFARRHRALVAGGVLAFVGLVVGGGFALWWLWQALDSAERATRQAHKATAAREFVQGVMAAGDPRLGPAADLTMSQVLERTLATLARDPPDDAGIEAAVRHSVGSTAQALSRHETALEQFDLALELTRALGDTEAPDALELRFQRAAALGGLGRLAEAEAELRAVLQVHRERLGDDHPQIAVDSHQLASNLLEQGRVEQALALHRQALEHDLEGRLGGTEAEAKGRAYVGDALRALGRYEDADRELRASVELYRSLPNPRPDAFLRALSDLALTAGARLRPDEALALDTEALAIARRFYPEGDPTIALQSNNLAVGLRRAGRFDEARAALDEAAAIYAASLGPDHRYTLGVELNRIDLEESPAERVRRLQVLVPRMLALGDDPLIPAVLLKLGWSLYQLGRHDQALERLGEALDWNRRVLPSGHDSTATILQRLGIVELARERPARALEHFREARVLYAAAHGEDSPHVQANDGWEASALAALGEPADGG